jgi:hypothetical protein
MLARFRVLLPFLLHLREGDDTPPQHIQEGEYDISIQPLTRSQVKREGLNLNADMPLSAIINAMEPAVPPPRSGTVRIDGAPSWPKLSSPVSLSRRREDPPPAWVLQSLYAQRECYEPSAGIVLQL